MLCSRCLRHNRRAGALIKWLGAMAFHIVIVAALIIPPLYATGTIHLSEYNKIPVIAPPPPPAPAGGPVAPHITRPKAKLSYTLQKLTAPKVIPKNVSSGSESVSGSAPDLEGVQGGVPGGVIGGQAGGIIGGFLGGTETTAPTPPPPRPIQKVVRVGSHIKAPRQTHSVAPCIRHSRKRRTFGAWWLWMR